MGSISNRTPTNSNVRDIPTLEAKKQLVREFLKTDLFRALAGLFGVFVREAHSLLVSTVRAVKYCVRREDAVIADMDFAVSGHKM